MKKIIEKHISDLKYKINHLLILAKLSSDFNTYNSKCIEVSKLDKKLDKLKEWLARFK